MIPIIKILTSKFNLGINWLRTHFNLIAVIIISIFTAIIFLQNKTIKNKNLDIDRLNNNVCYYQELNDSSNQNNRILRFTIDELKNSKDSVIVELNNTRKELKIKDKELKLAQSQTQEIKLDTNIVVKTNDFSYEIKPNELTNLLIEKKDSILTAKLDIKNNQTLFISSKRQYKNTYKNWFRRLLKFDFKKHNVYKYDIINSNDLINVTDTKIIQIEE